MAELDGFRELFVIGVLRDDQEGGVLMEGGANVEPVLAMVIPGMVLARLGVDGDSTV